jgi:TP901 family phage tail tape measure protein
MAESYTHLINVIFQTAGGKPTEDQITKIKTALKGLPKDSDSAASSMGNFEKAIRRVTVVAPIWMAFRAVLQSVLKLINEQVKFLVDLETAMARIQVVGKGTAIEYDNLRNSLIGLSVVYGSSATAAVESAVVFAQQGRTVKETIELTRAAMIASQVLGTTMKTTVDDLTAAINSFNIPISKSIDIIDKWINVEKNFAVTSADLAEATKVAGASASQLGITIDEFLGDVTAIVELTRKSGSEAARSLQFIYARLLTSAAPVLTTIGKVSTRLNEQGQATFALTNINRSATDVLDELASKWDTYTNRERLAIATSVASKGQMTSFMALMQNYNRAIEARITALTSAGQAERAFGIIQETTKIKLERLSSSWKALTSAIADTSAFKTVIDSINEFLNLLTIWGNATVAIANAANKMKDSTRKATETQISQAESLKELIILRDKYTKAPATESNITMLKRINDALYKVKENSNFTIDLSSINATSELDKFVKDVKEVQIRQEVDIDIRANKEAIEHQIKALKFEPSAMEMTLMPKFVLIKKFINSLKAIPEIKKLQEKLTTVDSKRDIMIKERLDAYEVEKTKIEANTNAIEEQAIQEEANTAEVEEKQRIEGTLARAKALNILNTKQLLDLEIKLVEASDFQYEADAKRLKLADLRLQKEVLIYEESVKQANVIADMIFDYEKANVIERGRLEQLVKLLVMKPDELVAAIKKNAGKSSLVLENLTKFNEDQYKAIREYFISKFPGYEKLIPAITAGPALPGKNTGEYGTRIIPNITQTATFGNININLPEGTLEDLLDKVKEQLDDRLKNDEDFQKFIAGVIRLHI